MQYPAMTPTLIGEFTQDIRDLGRADAATLLYLRMKAAENEPTNEFTKSAADLSPDLGIPREQVRVILNRLVDKGALEKLAVSSRFGTTFRIMRQRTAASRVVSR